MADQHDIKEDTVLYRVYPYGDDIALTQAAITCNSDVEKLVGDHIWYYEPVRLTEQIDSDVPCLVGETCFRDCVDDEWSIVRVLLEFTKLHPQLIASVEDSDGQFLLIEVAHLLPKWVKPETTINRVFLFQGAVHIVGYPSNPREVGVLPVGVATVGQSLQCIRSHPSLTVASPTIQAIIGKRIQQSRVPLHSAHCLLPLPAAHILTSHTHLVSAIVHAFCDRDKKDTKVIRRLEDFSPKDNELVVRTVTFPRLLYAKLCHQHWNIPSTYSTSVTGGQHKTALLGMKLTCGLEILSKRYSNHTSSSQVGVANSGWGQFLSSLTERGYFKGELEGSQLYRTLYTDAHHYYDNVVKSDLNKLSVLEVGGATVSRVLSEGGWEEGQYTSSATPLAPADDDSWLDMSPDELDSVLQNYNDNVKTHSHSTKSHSHSAPPTSSLECEELAYGMRSFVDNVSSVDGAEFPWSSEGGAGVTLEPDTFVSTLETLMDKLCYPKGDDDSTDSSDGSCDGDGEDEDMISVMEQLQQELSGFGNLKEEGVVNQEEEDGAPVDIDFKVVSNLLESYSEQGGVAGPASNILSTLGIDIPQNV